MAYRHLTGPAMDCIKAIRFDTKSYPLILKTLEDRFGKDEDQEEFHLGAIENLNKVSGRDLKGLRKFYCMMNYKPMSTFWRR